ncbi:hypothetical protein V8B97DRAFT_1019318 [Scleroderma yunnanense]
MGLRSIKYPAHALARLFRKYRPRRHPSWDPLDHLPYELVSAIFEQWLWGELEDQHSNPSQLPVLLCLVSQSWRKVVYANPFLWQSVTIDVSLDKVRSLTVLRDRISRTQNVPLMLHLIVKENPNLEALRILFSQSHKFCELSLTVSDSSWWKNVPLGPFSQLRKLAVKAWPARLGCRKLTSIFSTAPLLRSTDWSAPLDPSPLLGVYGDTFLSLDLGNAKARIPSILNIFAACPQLCDATINVIAEGDASSLQHGLVMGNLRRLVVTASGYLPVHLLASICAPRLIAFGITWCGSGSRAPISLSLESFLSHSPLIQNLTLNHIIHSEDSLIRILRAHSRVRSLAMLNTDEQANLLTDRVFRLLTPDDEETPKQRKVLLPRLEELVINGGLRKVKSNAIFNLLGSRGLQSFTSWEPRSRPAQVGRLKVVEIGLHNDFGSDDQRLWMYGPRYGDSITFSLG